MRPLARTMTDETVTAVVLLFRNLSNTCFKKTLFQKVAEGQRNLAFETEEETEKDNSSQVPIAKSITVKCLLSTNGSIVTYR